MDNSIEVKLHIFRKQQDNLTTIGFTAKHEDIPNYLATAALGKRYYMVLVDADDYDDSNSLASENSWAISSATRSIILQSSDKITFEEQTTGDKLRTRAVLLCKDKEFQKYIGIYITSPFGDPTESECAYYMRKKLNIKSRSELSTSLEAQQKFREFDKDFKDWQFEQEHADNLDRF